MSQTQTDEKLIALQESYNKIMGIDKNYRENLLSAENGKKVKIYESEELQKIKEKGIAHKMTSFGSRGSATKSTSTSSRFSKTLRKSLLVVNLLLHFAFSLLAVFAVFIIMSAIVLPVIPEFAKMPAVVISYIFTLVVIFKS